MIWNNHLYLSLISLSNKPFRLGNVFLALPFEVTKPQCCRTYNSKMVPILSVLHECYL